MYGEEDGDSEDSQEPDDMYAKEPSKKEKRAM